MVKNYPPFEFNKTYKKTLKIYFEIFLKKKNKKINWFGIASLPLVTLTTAFIFIKLNKKNKKLININDYTKRHLSINYFQRMINNIKVKNFVYKIISFLFFFKKKVTVIYSTNTYTNSYCKNQNLFKIKYNPLESLDANEISKYYIDHTFDKFFRKYLIKINEVFFPNSKKFYKFTELEQYFHKFYKIYLLYVNETKNLKKLFITSYSGIFFIRLFMGAIQFNKKSKIINLTHGDVEVLNQEPDIVADGVTLCNLQISKTIKYNIKLKKFLLKKYHLDIPKFFSYRHKNNFNLKSLTNEYSKNFDKKARNKVLIVGYPISNKFDLTANHIYPSKMFIIENKLIKSLKKSSFQVFYKSHPDTNKEMKKKIIEKRNFLTERFEDICEEFDYLIFTYHRSTTLGYALSKKIPISLLTYKTLDLEKKTYQLFKKRISFINCEIYKNNLAFNEKLLKKKVIESKKLVNLEAVKKLIL